MKKSFLFLLAISLSCTNPKLNPSTSSSLPLSSEFKSYWFDGTAEISSYALEQSRYGAPREGTAVLIYVTEDFLPDKQVKANQKSESTQTVLKLNRTKNFLTGIYPYSIMTSIFSRLGQSRPLVKTTTSIQEWCGQAYLQLNRREGLEVKSHSYFEGEADQNFQFKDALTEEELWVWIRTQPDRLPQGTLELLPSFEFIRLKHKPLQLYQAEAVLEQNDTLHTYSLTYAELQRKLSISFTKEAPHTILDWTEEDLKNPNQITRAQIKKTVKLPYWKLNKLGDDQFRDSLGLN
jgi:hypothetical protein